MLLMRVWRILCLLRIDIYYCLFLVGTALISVPLNQMIQDKVCLNELNLGKQICDNLAASSEEYESAKNQVLETATSIKNYQNLIATAPGIIFSLFIGRWIDLYPSHLRYILTLPCIGGAIQASLLIYQTVHFDIGIRDTLYTFISYGLLGGDTLASIGAYTYIARKTLPEYRSLRFSIMELFKLSAYPVASALGGKLLSLQPWFQDNYRNYMGVFIVCLLTKLTAILWTLILIYDAEGSLSSGTENFESSPNSNSKSISNQVSKPSQGKFLLSNVLDLKNIYLTLKTFTRKRVNYGRAQIWHITLAMSAAMGIFYGQTSVMFQFTQKAFDWDYKFFSYVDACIIVLPLIGKPTFTYLFIHRLHFTDTTLASFGCVTAILGFTLKGGILNPMGYYLSSIPWALSGLVAIGMRSMLTRIVDHNEIGQVYVINLAFITAAPFVSSIFYSSIFNATLQTYPGMVFHASSLVLFYPLAVSLACDLLERRSVEKMTGKTEVTYTKRPSMIEIKLEPINDGNNNQNFT